MTASFATARAPRILPMILYVNTVIYVPVVHFTVLYCIVMVIACKNETRKSWFGLGDMHAVIVF